MATAADVARLRRLTNEPTTDPYGDLALSTIIEESESVEAAAAQIWREKAAVYAGLVDTTEGSSSRKMSQLRDAAVKMADLFAPGATAVEEAAASRPRSRAIVRG